MDFFDRVHSELTQVYPALTNKSEQSGYAELFLESKFEPFASNIRFYPNPPGKKNIYDVDQLSGGEKTIAALALLFAMAIVKKPFMIALDEVDAFLDKENVDLLTSFLKNGYIKTQFVMITHKEDLYGKAQALVGMSYAKHLSTSKAYSLDLRKF